MTHPLLKKHSTHREQFIKMFQSEFNLVTLKWIKNELSKDNLSVISFMMLYYNGITLVYKIIGSVTYTIVDEYICLDSLVLLQ